MTFDVKNWLRKSNLGTICWPLWKSVKVQGNKKNYLSFCKNLLDADSSLVTTKVTLRDGVRIKALRVQCSWIIQQNLQYLSKLKILWSTRILHNTNFYFLWISSVHERKIIYFFYYFLFMVGYSYCINIFYTVFYYKFFERNAVLY